MAQCYQPTTVTAKVVTQHALKTKSIRSSQHQHLTTMWDAVTSIPQNKFACYVKLYQLPTHDKWVCVTTAWLVLKLQMEEQPPDTQFADKQQQTCKIPALCVAYHVSDKANVMIAMWHDSKRLTSGNHIHQFYDRRTYRYWRIIPCALAVLNFVFCQTICPSLTLCTCSFVVKLRECWGKSIVNFALLPVTPVLFTWSILYWACKDGNKAAVMLRLCNSINTFTELLVQKDLINSGQLPLEKVDLNLDSCFANCIYLFWTCYKVFWSHSNSLNYGISFSFGYNTLQERTCGTSVLVYLTSVIGHNRKSAKCVGSQQRGIF